MDAPGSSSDSDTGELTHAKVRAHIKRTQACFKTTCEADLEDTPSPEEEIGTQSVILEGQEISLEDSSEVTPERVKAVLAEARKKAKSLQDSVIKSNSQSGIRSRSKRHRRPPGPLGA